MPRAEDKYKDRLFTFIFGSEEHKDWTLSLYNAVNGSSYTDTSLISMTTIRQVLYLGMHNDVSFLIADEMNMYEQQATFNPNMPLRMLQYAGSLYEKDIVARRKYKFGKTLITLPVPRLVTFYNGADDMPDEMTLRLSDAFPENERDKADIEVTVHMININNGHNPEIMTSCPPLDEYAQTVEKITESKKDIGLEEAIDQAIDTMPDSFVIKPYLTAHKAEVKDMLLTEYNEALQLELSKEEGRAEGEGLMAQLMARLFSLGRLDDAQKATTDPVFRKKLYKEFQIA